MIQCKKYEVLNYEEFSGGHISHHAAKKIYYDCSKLWDFSTAEMAENAQTDIKDWFATFESFLLGGYTVTLQWKKIMLD